ncbi:MAG: amidohydrolase [Anaerolineales bacterium]|jgi:amidohydrolase|nr:amidohydrolase [Anaerolineales bacterium]
MNSIDLLSEAEQLFEYTRALRRDFHRHPELGFQEVRTAGIVARELAALGLEVSSGIAETGVIALVEGEQPGPVALLRFDMDALPILEQNQVEYASEKAGVMHACGHDGHTAIGLTVARLLSAQRAGLHGTAKLVFQPAEEGLGGAKRMVDEGVLENPRPDLSLSLHLWNERPLGWLGIADGPTMAAAEIFKLRLTGRGGHGAVPNLAIDPVVAAAQVISALQSVVSRNVSPLDAAVISVTTVQAGEAFNVIPSEAVLQGTIRTFKPEVRKRVLERFEQVVGGVAGAMECQAEIELKGITPAVVNDPRIAARVQAAAARLFPESPVATGFSTMGSEDMAFMMQDIPGCYFFLGSANSERGLDYAHHHPRFDFDERVLPRAAALMAAAAMEFLS